MFEIEWRCPSCGSSAKSNDKSYVESVLSFGAKHQCVPAPIDLPLVAVAPADDPGLVIEPLTQRRAEANVTKTEVAGNQTD